MLQTQTIFNYTQSINLTVDQEASLFLKEINMSQEQLQLRKTPTGKLEADNVYIKLKVCSIQLIKMGFRKHLIETFFVQNIDQNRVDSIQTIMNRASEQLLKEQKSHEEQLISQSLAIQKQASSKEQRPQAKTTSIDKILEKADALKQSVQILLSQSISSPSKSGSLKSQSKDIKSNELLKSKQLSQQLSQQQQQQEKQSLQLQKIEQIKLKVCDLCLNFFLEKDFVESSKKCNHESCCKTCFKDYITIKIQGPDILNLTCINCDEKIEEEQLIKNLQDFPDLVQKYHRYKKNATVEQNNERLAFCPSKLCNGESVLDLKQSDRKPDLKQVKCKTCQIMYCFICKHQHSFNPEGNCSENLDKIEQNLIAEQDLRICPTCRNGIYRTYGCNHITCGKCQAHFCWLCRQLIDPSNPGEHYKQYNGNSNCDLFYNTKKRYIEEDDPASQMFLDYLNNNYAHPLGLELNAFFEIQFNLFHYKFIQSLTNIGVYIGLRYLPKKIKKDIQSVSPFNILYNTRFNNSDKYLNGFLLLLYSRLREMANLSNLRDQDTIARPVYHFSSFIISQKIFYFVETVGRFFGRLVGNRFVRNVLAKPFEFLKFCYQNHSWVELGIFCTANVFLYKIIKRNTLILRLNDVIQNREVEFQQERRMMEQQ